MNVQDYLAEASRHPWRWGGGADGFSGEDCTLFVANWALALTGVDPGVGLRGSYSIDDEAVAIVARAGGFDARIGPGSGTPWGAYEVQDLALNLLSTGAAGRYDPDLTGHHPDERTLAATPDGARKMRVYGAGLGYVMRKHGYRFRDYLPHLLRPVAGMAVYTLTGRPALARRSREILAGRWSGWRTAPAGTTIS